MFLKKRVNISAVETLEKHVQLLSDESKKYIERLGQASDHLGNDWEAFITKEAQNIISINKGKESLLKTISLIEGNKRHKIHTQSFPRYQISSIFLDECREYLTSDPSKSERLHLVTGTVTEDETIVLSRMEKVKMESQSSVYVQGERPYTHHKIVSMSEDSGHLLLGMFHSHTSRGAASTSPSSIDINNLERKAKIGIDCLGGIFSFDGYIRFFSLKEFEIDIYGKGVERIEAKPTYKIFKIINKGETQ